MDEINITAAQYSVDFEGEIQSIKATINGVEMYIPLQEGNRHYSEIMRQVAAGELTVDEPEGGTED